ncbi:MAG: hypothetical protein GY820_07400 [Gammaproteobacteria bacterium]|nr:hypothetical protein [Gammaproteobacteria bacterium]
MRRKARLERYYGLTVRKDQYITADNSLSETERRSNNLSVVTSGTLSNSPQGIQTKTNKQERAWEKCSVCDNKLTSEKSILCGSCGRRHHKKCVTPNQDQSNMQYCGDCGADLTKPVEKSAKSFQVDQNEDQMAEDRLREEVRQLTQLLAEEREENAREKAEKEAEREDLSNQTTK